MSDADLATEQSKTALENSVTWLLSDRVGSASAPIVTKKYITNANLLVYLTLCSLPDAKAPRLKVQVLQRVKGGVHETGYQLYGDHRFEKYENDMIFGTELVGADGSNSVAVGEKEIQLLLQLLGTLQSARQGP